MNTLGIVGWSGSGKTTLLVALVADLTARGVRVSTMKHAHHDFDIDQPGKDSHRHRQAGAVEVLVASKHRWALMHEHHAAPEPTAEQLIGHLTPVDLLLIEGFKGAPHAKLEVHRPALGQPLLAATDPTIIAVATDAEIPGLRLPALDLNAPKAIASHVLAHFGLVPPGAPER